MTYVVTENCIKCVYTDCVVVCPADCFRVGPNFMVIEPEECLDCALCVAECPVGAIMADDDVPESQLQFIKLNEELARKWPALTKMRSSLPEADNWSKVTNKLQYLER
jgi:ferredoxin